MVRRLLSILAMFALLVAPIQMIGGAAAAMPHPQPAAATGHCDQAPDSGEEQVAIDCLIACAGLPALPPSAPAGHTKVRAIPASAALPSLRGLPAEAATPPPRFS